MKRNELLSKISDMLLLIGRSIEQLGSMNLNNDAVLAENTFKDLLNVIYKASFVNANSIKHNMPGIDLIDWDRKILVQISKECTRSKIQESLDKIPKDYIDGYSFWFLSISKPAKRLRGLKYNAPVGIKFAVDTDAIKDSESLLSDMQGLGVEELENILKILNSEFSLLSLEERKTSGLAIVIQYLSQEPYSYDDEINSIPFEIDQKIKLNNLKELYDDFLNFVSNRDIVQKVYDTYDLEGKNKSLAVLHAIRKVYLELSEKESGLPLFRSISRQLYKKVADCPELKTFHREEIELYIDIIMYDAFIKCKIFKRPELC